MIMERGKERGTWERDLFPVKVVSKGVAAIGKETKALGGIIIVMNAGIGIWVMRGWKLRSVKLSLFCIFLLLLGSGT